MTDKECIEVLHENLTDVVDGLNQVKVHKSDEKWFGIVKSNLNDVCDRLYKYFENMSDDSNIIQTNNNKLRILIDILKEHLSFQDLLYYAVKYDLPELR